MIAGLRIGHWTSASSATGCTVFLLPPASVCAAEVRGQASGTREVALLEPGGATTEAHAVVLAGGSAFGLAAADGVASALRAAGTGIATPAGPVPIVAAAVVYDLALGPAAHPDAAAGRAAAAAAGPAEDAPLGTVGVGTGATVGKIDGPPGWMKGGVGAARVALPDGCTVAAWAVANALGDVVGEDGRPLAGLRRGGRLAGSVAAILASPPPRPLVGEATTLAVVATDATLDKRDAWRLARAGQGGIAQATAPAATSYDGDTVFAVATGGRPVASFLALETAATVAVAGAVRHAVRVATALHDCPALGG